LATSFTNFGEHFETPGLYLGNAPLVVWTLTNNTFHYYLYKHVARSKKVWNG